MGANVFKNIFSANFVQVIIKVSVVKFISKFNTLNIFFRTPLDDVFAVWRLSFKIYLILDTQTTLENSLMEIH